VPILNDLLMPHPQRTVLLFVALPKVGMLGRLSSPLQTFLHTPRIVGLQMSYCYADGPSLKPLENQLCHWFPLELQFCRQSSGPERRGAVGQPAILRAAHDLALEEEAHLDLKPRKCTRKDPETPQPLMEKSCKCRREEPLGGC
jgi:hypothetical protein